MTFYLITDKDWDKKSEKMLLVFFNKNQMTNKPFRAAEIEFHSACFFLDLKITILYS